MPAEAPPHAPRPPTCLPSAAIPLAASHALAACTACAASTACTPKLQLTSAASTLLLPR